MAQQLDCPTTWLDMLKATYAARTEKNPRYSLRAFAAWLDVHPSALSRIFAGKQALSEKACLKILKKLNLPKQDCEKFIHSFIEYRVGILTSHLKTACEH